MPEAFWKKKSDPILVKQIEDLEKQFNDKLTELEKTYNDRLATFETLAGNLGAENAALKEEIATRHGVLSDDLNAMESRLMTRIEEVEDETKVDQPSSKIEDNEASSGRIGWTERKRSAASSQADPSVFNKPYVRKHKPAPVTTEAPKE